MSKVYIVEMFDSKEKMWESLPSYHNLEKAKEVAESIAHKDKRHTRVVSLVTSCTVKYSVSVEQYGE